VEDLDKHFNTWKDTNTSFESQKIRPNTFNQTSNSKIPSNFFNENQDTKGKQPIQWTVVDSRKSEGDTHQDQKINKNKFQQFQPILPPKNRHSGIDKNLEWKRKTNLSDLEKITGLPTSPNYDYSQWIPIVNKQPMRFFN
jgi:hypothetical protein